MTELEKRRVRRLRNSQIAPLIPNFCGAPFKLAPELEADLVRIRDILKVTIIPVWPETRFLFRADLSNNTIECGICSMERLWAYCYVYGQLLQATDAEQLLSNSDFVMLLVWANQPTNTQREIPWPPWTASPKKTPNDPAVRFANDLFIGVSGFILLHELGHLIKKTEHYNRLIDGLKHNHAQEFEADEIAWDFIAFSHLTKIGDAKVKKLRVGILVLALSIIAANDAFQTGAFATDTHPKPIDRIDRLIAYLEKWGNDGGETARAAEQVAARVIYFAAALIMRFGAQDITAKKQFESPRATIEYARKFIEIPLAIDWDEVDRYVQAEMRKRKNRRIPSSGHP